MRNPYIEIIIDPDGKSLQQELQEALRAYEKVAAGIDAAFRKVDLSDTLADTVRLNRHTRKLSGQIAYLRMNLGSLRKALAEAFAPIGALVLPVVNEAITRLRSFLHAAAAAVAAVTEQIFGTAHLGEAADSAAKSYGRLGAAAKKSLAAFDQIERLNGASGSSADSGIADPRTPVTEKVRAMANRILQFLQPLLAIDFTPLKTALRNLWAAVQPLLQQLGGLLEWLWQAVAAPFIAWCVQTLLPVFTNLVTEAIQSVANATSPLITGLKLVWDAMQPVVEFIRNALITCLQAWQQIFGELALQMQEKGPAIATVFNGIRDVITRLWAAVSPVLSAMLSRFSEVFTGIGRVASQVFGGLLEGLAGVTEFLAGLFTGDWKRAWNGLLLFLKSIVNSFIGLLNAMLVKLTSSLNAVVRLVSKLKFTVPKWVPGIGGEVFQLPMQSFQAPQIPYLAKGAVLPANKPFLAVVGDQKHGTNIEAPASLLRQTVAEAMDGYMSANMAGHSATVGILREILEAVLGIEIGDETIARANGRYQAKMAIVKGG